MIDIEKLIGRVLAGPIAPEKEYVVAGHTYNDVYGIAAGIRDRFSSTDSAGGPVCICTEDRGIIAAALLASLAGGPLFVLPYSLSPRVLSETSKALKFKYAVADPGIDLPDGVTGITFEHADWASVSSGKTRDANSVFGYLFTGGSTGKPKVWSKTPMNLFAEAGYQVVQFGYSTDDIIAATVPSYHIYGLLYTVMAPFLASASVLGGMYHFPHEIASVLSEYPVTVLVSVPVHYRVLNGVDIKAPHLRLAFSSAGPLDRDDAIAFYRQTGIGPEEIYGSTETGGIAYRSAAVGRDLLEPFDCIEWMIRDELLCVKSPFVSPDLPVDDNGFFTTGDRVAPAGDNSFTLLGRADSVVKVGGKRVDLLDVRDKIKSVPGVRDAFLFSMPGRKGRDADIAAAVEADITEIELRSALNGSLEQYAVPRRFRIVGKMPTTDTGKYDSESIMKLFDAEQE